MTARPNRRLREFLCCPLTLGLLCFFTLIVLNFSHLTDPPYWDDMFSPHNQALWLRNHRFNFLKLWSEGGNFWEGGSNVYPFSLVAVFYAMLYSLFSPQSVHVIGHLLNIAAISAIFALSYATLKQFSHSSLSPLLWCVAALCEPVMAGRTTELGRESLLGLAVAAAFFLMSRKKYHAMLSIMFLSFLIKPTGILLLCAMAAFLVLARILNAERYRLDKNRSFMWKFGIAFSVIIVLYKLTSAAQGGAFSRLGDPWANIIFHFGTLMPFSAFLLGCVILTATVMAIRSISDAIKNRHRMLIDNRLAVMLFLLVFICGFWTSFMIFRIPLPRYTAITVFPIFVFLGMAIRQRIASPIFASLLGMGGFVLWYCQMLPPLPPPVSRSGDLLERSREYLDDLRGNQELCAFVEEHFFDHVIVAKAPFLQMLTIPEYGYVSRPLPHVFSAAKNPPLYCPVKIVQPEELPPDAIFIYARNVCEYGQDDYCLMPYRDDKIVLMQGKLPATNVVYIKNPQRKLITVADFRSGTRSGD